MSKMRSPNYPAYSLRNCVEWVERIWQKEGRTTLDPEIAAVAAGYKGLSGPSRTAIASMKKFGLLEETGEGLRVSSLTLSILHSSSPGDATEALRDAALKPSLFAQLAETHLQASVKAIASYLITKLGFSQTGATACAEAFQDTIIFAKLDDPTSFASIETDSETPEHPEANIETSHDSLPIAIRDRARVLVWPLTRGIHAEVSFSSGDLSEEDVDLLCAYLALAKRGLLTKGPGSGVE